MKSKISKFIHTSDHLALLISNEDDRCLPATLQPPDLHDDGGDNAHLQPPSLVLPAEDTDHKSSMTHLCKQRPHKISAPTLH